MSSKKVIFAVLLAFVLAIGAGTVMGVGLARLSDGHRTRPSLADELSLTPDQRTKAEKIWNDVMQNANPRTFGEKRQDLANARDEAILKLIPENQKPDYEKIMQDFNANLDALNNARNKMFQDANDETIKLLSAEQATKYKEILARRAEGRNGRGRGPGPGGFGSSNSPGPGRGFGMGMGARTRPADTRPVN